LGKHLQLCSLIQRQSAESVETAKMATNCTFVCCWQNICRQVCRQIMTKGRKV